MTVRELINELLDKEMNSEVMLFTKDPNRPDITGVIFHITGVSASKCAPEIIFDDWRDETDSRISARTL